MGDSPRGQDVCALRAETAGGGPCRRNVGGWQDGQGSGTQSIEECFLIAAVCFVRVWTFYPADFPTVFRGVLSFHRGASVEPLGGEREEAMRRTLEELHVDLCEQVSLVSVKNFFFQSSTA